MNGDRKGASLYNFRDLDLMLQIGAAAEGISSGELAEAIGLGVDGTQAAAVRLSWMRKYGMVSWDEKRRVWSLNSAGERVVEARLRGAAARTIESIPDEAMIEVMAHVTARWRHGDPVNAHLLRREFLYGTQRR